MAASASEPSRCTAGANRWGLWRVVGQPSPKQKELCFRKDGTFASSMTNWGGSLCTNPEDTTTCTGFWYWRLTIPRPILLSFSCITKDTGWVKRARMHLIMYFILTIIVWIRMSFNQCDVTCSLYFVTKCYTVIIAHLINYSWLWPFW